MNESEMPHLASTVSVVFCRDVTRLFCECLFIFCKVAVEELLGCLSF